MISRDYLSSTTIQPAGQNKATRSLIRLRLASERKPPKEDSMITFVKRTLLLLAIAICLAVVGWLIATGGCSDPTANSVDAGGGVAKRVDEVEVDSADVEILLNGKNTDIQWTGSNSIGQKPSGFFYELSGVAIVDSNFNRLKQLEFTIDMNGVKAMADSLTKKLKHKGFFEVDKYPESKFASTSVSQAPRPGDPAGTNCIVEGNFQLRDVTRSIIIPMQVTQEGDAIKIASEFKLNRRDYGVVYSDPTGDKLIRDDVLISISINSAAKKSGESAKVALKPTEPAENNFTETIRETLVEFDMVLVPGDEAKGIAPFYIGKTEVTWNEFDFWALCKNMSDKETIAKISNQLRPSSPHDLAKVYRGWGRDKQPVVGVSRLAAQLYCQWLSGQTGRTYRLPTPDEWDRAFVLGGSELDASFESDQLEKLAWFDENALAVDDEGFDQERAMPVGLLGPNKLGIHDMLGNASEWVGGTGNESVVRGGHFKLSSDELTGSHREVEDQDIWNKDYPQEPKSKWWYVNADYVGFRVVCEMSDPAKSN